MKKYFIMLVMMLTMSVYSFAEENTATKMAERYELKINHRRLACILDMSSDQMEMSNDIISELESDMMFAAVMNTEKSRNAVVANAVKKNTKYMHYILNDAQYKKYLMLLNLTLEHRGFDITKISK